MAPVEQVVRTRSAAAAGTRSQAAADTQAAAAGGTQVVDAAAGRLEASVVHAHAPWAPADDSQPFQAAESSAAGHACIEHPA